MKQKNLFTLLIGVLLLVGILSGCSYNPYSSDYYSKENHSLFENYAKAEAHYLFFGSIEAERGDKVSIFFPEDISTLDFTNCKLAYQKNELNVSCHIEPLEKDRVGNGFYLVIDEYVPGFDSILINYKNKPLYIYTGYFCFEERKSENMDLDYKYHLLPYKSIHDIREEDITEFSLMPEYPGKLQVIYPKALPKELLIVDFKQKEDKPFYQNSIKPNKGEFEKKGLKRLDFELIYALDNKTNEKIVTYLGSARIPFEPIL